MKFIQRNIIKISGLLGLIVLFLLSRPVLAAGEDYPAKPVTINVGMAPGGASSIGAHIIAEGMQKYLGKPQPFIILHKPGSFGDDSG